MTAKLISIIGPPASGKTTLARYLSQNIPASLIKEDYTGNPFLEESFLGDESYRLPSQLYFLMSRAKQLIDNRFTGEGVLYVSDYGFCQDRMYAKLRLCGEDFKLYRRVADAVSASIKPPDLLIALETSIDSLLMRIEARARDYERQLTANFLQAMRSEHLEAVRESKSEVMKIDTDKVDLRVDCQCAKILSQIRKKP